MRALHGVLPPTSTASEAFDKEERTDRSTEEYVSTGPKERERSQQKGWVEEQDMQGTGGQMVMKQEKIWTLLCKIVAAFVEMGYFFAMLFSEHLNFTNRNWEASKSGDSTGRPVDLLSRVHEPGPIACYNP